MNELSEEEIKRLDDELRRVREIIIENMKNASNEIKIIDGNAGVKFGDLPPSNGTVIPRKCYHNQLLECNDCKGRCEYEGDIHE